MELLGGLIFIAIIVIVSKMYDDIKGSILDKISEATNKAFNKKEYELSLEIVNTVVNFRCPQTTHVDIAEQITRTVTKIDSSMSHGKKLILQKSESISDTSWVIQYIYENIVEKFWEGTILLSQIGDDTQGKIIFSEYTTVDGVIPESVSMGNWRHDVVNALNSISPATSYWETSTKDER